MAEMASRRLFELWMRKRRNKYNFLVPYCDSVMDKIYILSWSLQNLSDLQETGVDSSIW